jgi:hypothetical protein
MTTPDDCPMIGLHDVNVIADGFVLGIRRVIADDELFNLASHKLYLQVSNHTIDGTKRWFGTKILAAIGAALFAAGLWLILRFGAPR